MGGREVYMEVGDERYMGGMGEGTGRCMKKRGRGRPVPTILN